MIAWPRPRCSESVPWNWPCLAICALPVVVLPAVLPDWVLGAAAVVGWAAVPPALPDWAGAVAAGALAAGVAANGLLSVRLERMNSGEIRYQAIAPRAT